MNKTYTRTYPDGSQTEIIEIDGEPDNLHHELERKPRWEKINNVIKAKEKYLELLQQERDVLTVRNRTRADAKEVEKTLDYYKSQEAIRKEKLEREIDDENRKYEFELLTLKQKHENKLADIRSKNQHSIQDAITRKEQQEQKLARLTNPTEQDLETVRVLKAKRDYEEALQTYPYKYKTLDMIHPRPTTFTTYNLPAPITADDIHLMNMRREAEAEQRRQQQEERREQERVRALAELRRQEREQAEQIRQQEKRRIELNNRITPSNSASDDEEEESDSESESESDNDDIVVEWNSWKYSLGEMYELLKDDIESLATETNRKSKALYEQNIHSMKNALIRAGIHPKEFQAKEQEIRKKLGV
jgi:hypothetical protein